MAGASEAEDPLGAARNAFERRDFRTAYTTFRTVDDRGPLPPDDLVLLADSAWWLGRISEFLDVTERLHQAYLADGRVDLAALHALGIGGTWMMRGEYAQGSGWTNRGRRLLEGQPRGQGHGLLLYFDAQEALHEQRLDDATAAAKDLQELGPLLGDETFTAFGLLIEGMAEVRRGHLREGFALMDEAMLPVLANRVSVDWAGNIYCTIMAICYDVMDLGRAREWTRATERWLEGFSDAVMYLGICRAHRLQLNAVDGAWSEVEREAAEVERDLTDMNLQAVAETAYQLGETYRIRGLFDLADASYAKAAERGRDPQPGAALLRLATGDAEGAWSTICAAVSSAGPDPFACARLLRAQVEIGLAAGHLGAAAAAADRMDEIRQRYRTPGFAAWADLARGAVLLAEGSPADAERSLSDAAATYRRMAAPYDAATDRSAAGQGAPGPGRRRHGGRPRTRRRRGVRPAGRSAAGGGRPARGTPPRRAHGPRGGGPGGRRRRRLQPGRGRRAHDHRGDRAPAPGEHLREARRGHPYGGRRLGARAGAHGPLPVICTIRTIRDRKTHPPVDASDPGSLLASRMTPHRRPTRGEPMTTLEKPVELDPAAVEAFADRMLGIVNGACTALMTSIGHQTGLFETMAGRASSTSAEIADAAGLDERYVREWLNAMTTARVIVHDPAARTYSLPAEHAAWLTDAAGPDNLARLTVFLPMLAEVEQGIVRCFREGGGLSYADFERFHQLMAADSSAVVDATLLDVVVPHVAGLAERLRAGIDVADVGCGSGHALNVLAAAYPNSRFVGYDLAEEAVAAARAEATGLGLTNTRFEVLDVVALDEVDAFDLVMAFDTIHDQAHPARVLSAIARALRVSGTFLLVDIKASSNVEDNLEHPMGTFLYTVSTMHCMTVSLGQGGVGLGTAWGEQLATTMLREAGFADIDVAPVDADPFNNYYVCRIGG